MPFTRVGLVKKVWADAIPVFGCGNNSRLKILVHSARICSTTFSLILKLRPKLASSSGCWNPAEVSQRRRRDSQYEPGKRSGAWQKMRINQAQEFVTRRIYDRRHAIRC